MSLSDLPTLTDLQATRRAQPKGEPSVIVRAEKKKSKAQAEADFRKAVWTRDQGRSRASGVALAKSGTDSQKVGEVHHVLKRSTHPEARLDPSNGILLSRAEHRMAEAHCINAPQHCYLEIQGPEDLSQPQTFTWRNGEGKALKTRIG